MSAENKSPREYARTTVLSGSICLCPRQESNLHHLLRREIFYPLNYEGVVAFSLYYEPDDLVNRGNDKGDRDDVEQNLFAHREGKRAAADGDDEKILD